MSRRGHNGNSMGRCHATEAAGGAGGRPGQRGQLCVDRLAACKAAAPARRPPPCIFVGPNRGRPPALTLSQETVEHAQVLLQGAGVARPDPAAWAFPLPQRPPTTRLPSTRTSEAALMLTAHRQRPSNAAATRGGNMSSVLPAPSSACVWEHAASGLLAWAHSWSAIGKAAGSGSSSAEHGASCLPLQYTWAGTAGVARQLLKNSGEQEAQASTRAVRGSAVATPAEGLQAGAAGAGGGGCARHRAPHAAAPRLREPTEKMPWTSCSRGQHAAMASMHARQQAGRAGRPGIRSHRAAARKVARRRRHLSGRAWPLRPALYTSRSAPCPLPQHHPGGQQRGELRLGSGLHFWAVRRCRRWAPHSNVKGLSCGLARSAHALAPTPQATRRGCACVSSPTWFCGAGPARPRCWSAWPVR